MKSILIPLFTVAISTLNAQNMERQIHPKDVVIQLFIATDQNKWSNVENCFSNEVLLDYSSMENPAATMNPKQITDAWKAILPGFTHTHHQLGNIRETINGNNAQVVAYGTATHYLEDEKGNVWTVVGTYDLDLIKEKKRWTIRAMKFNFKYQDGNTGLPQKAMNKVAGKPHPKTIAERNKEIVKSFLKALENENADEVASLFAEDGKHINPYHSGLFPEGAHSKEEIRAYWTAVFPNFEGMRFPVEEMYAMENPKMVYIKFQGTIKLKNNAGYYKNDYYATFKFNEAGKIAEYTEIFNPITAARSFGLIDKVKGSNPKTKK